MATAGVNRMMLWTDLEGRELDGGLRLGRLVRPEGRTAWFAATAADAQPLMVSITEALNDEEDLLARLRAAAEIHNPHVVSVRESFLTRVDDTPVVVAAMESTEENLGDVLRERTLSMAEADGLLKALVQGVAAIHGRGMTHARMEPASVLAMGDTIKLRSDCLQLGQAGSGWFARAAAENVRGLGRIVTQAVTRRTPASENDVVLQLLPEPMARAVRRALSGDATIGEVAALAGVTIVPESKPERLGPRMVAPAAVESPAKDYVFEKSSAGPAVPGLPSTLQSEPEKPAPKVIPMRTAEACVEAMAAESVDESSQPELLLQPREEDPLFVVDDDQKEQALRRSAPWIIAAALAVVLLTAWALYSLIHRGSVSQAKQPPAINSNMPARAVPTRAPIVTAQTTRKGSATVAMATPGWRVIAYTYRHEDQAEQKAHSLAQRYPRLSPGVFTLHGGAPYLVMLGGVMSKTDAEAVRREAIGMGLPRDTYAQNYR